MRPIPLSLLLLPFTATAGEGLTRDYTTHLRVSGLAPAQRALLRCREGGEARVPDRIDAQGDWTGQWTSEGRVALRCTWQGQPLLSVGARQRRQVPIPGTSGTVTAEILYDP